MKTTLYAIAFWIFLFAAIALTNGCASYEKQLVNQNGQRAYCQAAGFGLISSAIASSSFENCIARAQAKGYN